MLNKAQGNGDRMLKNNISTNDFMPFSINKPQTAMRGGRREVFAIPGVNCTRPSDERMGVMGTMNVS
jgi:hypothetical protein